MLVSIWLGYVLMSVECQCECLGMMKNMMMLKMKGGREIGSVCVEEIIIITHTSFFFLLIG
jgi:hypothetical protein